MVFSIFFNKLDVDNRDPILTATFLGNTLGLFPPQILFWVQLFVLTVISGCFTVLMATIIYVLIISRRPSMISYLIGFGVVIPLCIGYFPFWILEFFDVRNKLLRFCVSAVYPVLIMFRTSEAMFGFSPHTVESSYKNYVLYHVAGVETQYDKLKKRPLRATNQNILASLKICGLYFILIGLLYSIFAPSNLEPFQTSANGSEPDYQLKDIFDWRNICNNFVGTIFFQVYLVMFGSLFDVLAQTILGMKVKGNMMKNPVLKATSPSDFWSGRWNLLVHGILKRGAFKPVYRATSSKLLAVCVTFLASGLFHEYILCAINPSHLGFKPHYGKQTAFMMWNAALIMIESLVGKALIFQWMKRSLPAPILTILALGTAMPVAHWFLHLYTHSQMFDHGEMAFPIIKIIN